MYEECACFVMQMLYVCVLCASCGSSQWCVLHDLQFVNACRGCNRRPYRRGILQSRSHKCFIGSHECLLLFTPSCCRECFYDLCPLWKRGLLIGGGWNSSTALTQACRKRRLSGVYFQICATKIVHITELVILEYYEL